MARHYEGERDGLGLELDARMAKASDRGRSSDEVLAEIAERSRHER